jgi:hypothetical protein
MNTAAQQPMYCCSMLATPARCAFVASMSGHQPVDLPRPSA